VAAATRGKTAVIGGAAPKDRPEDLRQGTLQRAADRRSEGTAGVLQRRVDYPDPAIAEMAEMSIPAGTALYHATKPEYVVSIRSGIDPAKSNTTQLGKGFYTSWFSTGMEAYGEFVVRFELGRELKGQQVFTDSIRAANARDAALYKEGDVDAARAVKGDWDTGNDFLYTPRLDEKVDGQSVPHQVKITPEGVDALPLGTASVIETSTRRDTPISDFEPASEAARPAARPSFLADIGKKKK
jgi:hypothetical protein